MVGSAQTQSFEPRGPVAGVYQSLGRGIKAYVVCKNRRKETGENLELAYSM